MTRPDWDPARTPAETTGGAQNEPTPVEDTEGAPSARSARAQHERTPAEDIETGAAAPSGAAPSLTPLLRERALVLPAWLRAHVGRVVSVARDLARRYELDPERVEAAAWGHDLFRAHSDADLLAAAERFALPVDGVDRANPLLLHGPLAATVAQHEWNVRDPEVLEAIHWHTTAHPDMSLLATVVFLADKIEPSKLEARPDLEAVRARAQSDPQRALLAYLDLDLSGHLAAGRLVHPTGLAARNALLLSGRTR